MTKEAVLTELESQIGPLDEKAQRAVVAALELVGAPVPRPVMLTQSPRELKWQGENPPFAEVAKLSLDERNEVMSELGDRNRAWLEKRRRDLGARWMIVVDGEVLRHGSTLANYPPQEELRNLCHRTGKMLLLHAAPLLIEEAAPWNPTVYSEDFYPTVVVAFTGNQQSVEVTADFDTGAADVCVDSSLLEDAGIVTISDEEPWRRDEHLGRRFFYTFSDVNAVLMAADGSQRESIHRVICVRNWEQSPFVAVNPNRTALVGRDICLRLQPKITLDFGQHQTTLQW